MIDIKSLDSQEGLDSYKKDIANRGGDSSLVDEILKLNEERKKLIQEVEGAKAKQNKVGQEIAALKKNKEDASHVLKEMQQVSQQAKEAGDRRNQVEEKLNEILAGLPNRCHSTTPVGKGEEDNEVVRTVGDKPKFSFQAKEHGELGEALGIINFERAAKVAGARFSFLLKAGAALERGLIQFMMDVHSQDHGYEEVIPPFIVNSNALYGTGQFPKFKADVFNLHEHDYYLIPTAEVPVTNIYQDEILKEEDLPRKFVAYSPCFRSEAGSYGKDTKGLIRQHQFNKVELLKFTHPDNSYEEHEKLTADAEKILQRLELPYRVSALCTGDIGFSAAKCYDLEVWLPGQEAYREISSCSNFEDFQARRANIRFRPGGAKAKPQFVHTINGSGLAVGRTLIAIIENYQQEDGSIQIPQVLQKYMNGLSQIKA